MVTTIEGLKISQLPELNKPTGKEMMICQYGSDNSRFSVNTLTKHITSNVRSELVQNEFNTLNEMIDSLDKGLSSKQDIITNVNVNVNNEVGIPSGTVSVSGNTLNISLENIKGERGDDGITPSIKEIKNKLYSSYDGENWNQLSDNIAAWFNFTGTSGSSQANNIGKIQISRDGGNSWQDLSGEFTNSLHIAGYRTSIDLIPENQPQGAIWAIGPTYDNEDVEQTNPIYFLYVKSEQEWINNGRFTSISAGIVQELGDSDTETISQKAVTDQINKLYKYINDKEVVLSEEEYEMLEDKKEDVKYYLYEE